MTKTNIFISIVIYIFALSMKAATNLAEEGQIARSLRVTEQNLNKQKLDSLFVEAIKKGLKNKEDIEYFEKLASRWRKQPQWTFVANFNFLEFRVAEKVISTFAIKQRNPLIVVIDAKEYPLDKDQSLVNQIKKIYQKKEKLKASNWFQQLFLPQAEAQEKSNSSTVEFDTTFQDQRDIAIISTFAADSVVFSFDIVSFQETFLPETYCSDLRKKLGISRIENLEKIDAGSDWNDRVRITLEGSSVAINMQNNAAFNEWYFRNNDNEEAKMTIIESHNKINKKNITALEAELKNYIKENRINFTVKCESLYKPCLLRSTSESSNQPPEEILNAQENMNVWLKKQAILSKLKEENPLNCQYTKFPGGSSLVNFYTDECNVKEEEHIKELLIKNEIDSYQKLLDVLSEAPFFNDKDKILDNLLKKFGKNRSRLSIDLGIMRRINNKRVSAMISALRCCGRDICRAELLKETGVKLKNDEVSGSAK